MQETSPFVNKQDKQESFSPTPVLPRLDRLDRLLQLLEEKHNLSSSPGRHNTVEKVEEDEDQLLKKSLASALEEVQHKGTLVERLAMLETRVLQLSLAIDEGNASKSSSSTVAGYEKLDHGYDASPREKQEDVQVLDGQGRKSPLGVQHSVCELREKYEQFVGSRDWHNTRHRDGDTGSTKWQKTKQEGAQEVATMV